jgi:outer membrane protein assembly factor BamD (BamD/ComL family)
MSRTSHPTQPARRLIGAWLVLAVASFVAGPGCNVFKSGKDDEYTRARNEIYGYYDSEGNWIRPEGAKAENRRGSGVSPWVDWIPGVGESPSNPPQARALFQEADKLFEQAKNTEGDERQKLFNQAADKYKDAGKRWKSSALEQDAMLMTAESYFFAEEFPEAEQTYAKLLKEYPRTRYQDLIDSRRMEIAIYWLRYDAVQHQPFYVLNLSDDRRPWNDTKGHGKRTLENTRLENPIGKLSDDITMELARTAFEDGDYQAAADHYEDLRTTYPDSPHQFNAHFLGLKSIVETYAGPEYDDRPLNEGEKLVKQIVRLFPQDAQREKEYLSRVYAEIRYRKAERLWNSGSYRMNRKENKSARLYFDRLLTEYSDTPFADDARAAVDQIKDLPGDPPQRFAWLANLFPDRDPVKPLIHRTSP